MKRKEITALKGKSLPDMKKELTDARARLEQLRFELRAGKVKNAHSIKEERKLIARLLTFIANHE